MTGQPTALIRIADAGDLYLSWRWSTGSADRGVCMLPGAPVRAAVARLTAALAAPTEPGSLEAAMTTGAFADYDTELALGQELSRALLPAPLAAQLYDLHQRGIRPQLRIQPAPSVAQVPWELLAPSPELRLLDIAELSLLAPASIVHAPDRIERRWSDTRHLPVVAALDPRVPGFRADSPLGSVLGRMAATMPLTARVAEYAAQHRLLPAVADPVDAFRRTDLDRTWLAGALRDGASRLIYVGHVTAAAPASGEGEHAELHLSCTADTTGFATPARTHRPLNAKDLLLGTHTLSPEPLAGQQLWPMPSRVALIACESGGDLRFTEALGLTTAMINNGAQLVTATRWPLPTDLAFHRLAGVPPTAHPLQSAICAIDSAHEQPDPIAALTAWQRDQLDDWRTHRTIEHSPLLWSAFATVTT